MRVSRRGLVLGAAGAGALAWTGRALWPGPAKASPQQLHIPPLVEGSGRQPVALRVQAGRSEFFSGRFSDTLGYNGSYLGPVIRVRRGERVPMRITNALAEPTTVHWHGLLIPGPLDGGPHQQIAPGGQWNPVLPIDQPAATLIYHSHVHGGTAEQVYRGLVGVLLVTDSEEQALGLPADYGVDDLPLVLQDRQFESGRLVLPSGMMTLMQGRRGDTMLVNGTAHAVAPLPGRLVRLRLINGSNARIFDLHFDDGREFHWIASESGLLAQPVALRRISLAPGQRIEVLADFSSGRPVSLATGPDPNMGMMGMMGGARDSGAQPLIRFEPQSGTGHPARIPDRLAQIEPPTRAAALRTRRLVLNMGMGGGMMGGGMMGGGMMGGARTGTGSAMFAINGAAFDMNRIDQQIRLGDTEIWEVSGEMMAHPIHLHGVHFQVLSRGGAVPSLRDQGWRDTVLVQEPVELLVRFTQPTLGTAFMYHCHILEHEDNGMMGQFSVA